MVDNEKVGIEGEDFLAKFVSSATECGESVDLWISGDVLAGGILGHGFHHCDTGPGGQLEEGGLGRTCNQQDFDIFEMFLDTRGEQKATAKRLQAQLTEEQATHEARLKMERATHARSLEKIREQLAVANERLQSWPSAHDL